MDWSEGVCKNLLRISQLMELQALRDAASIQMGQYAKAMEPLRGIVIEPEVKEKVKAELIAIIDVVEGLMKRAGDLEEKMWGVRLSAMPEDARAQLEAL